jgi:DNA-binding transcriptional ArsR family regulator
VPRASTTSDVFNAIADSHRRDILVYLAPGERPVSDMVAALRIRQPSVSKHLKVLRSVNLVHARRNGRQMLYRTNAGAIQPVHEWTRVFESFWRNQLIRVKGRAEAAQRPAMRPKSDEGEKT